MVMAISRKTWNDFHLSLCFTVLYASCNSMTRIQQMFAISMHHDNPLYDVNGYVTLGINHACTSLATFIAPLLVTVIGWKWTMFIGAISYNYFLLYYFESNWLTYLGVILNGFGGGFLWLSQGTYLVLNSEIKSTTQSVGIFWTMYKSSFFIGNAALFFLFNDNDNLYLDRSMRQEIIIILASIVVCAIIMLSLLRNPIRQNQVDELKLTAMGEIKDIYRTMKSKDTLLYNFIYIFAGFNTTFQSVMGSSLGFTKYLSNNSKIYTPLSGLTQGVGEIAGCLFSAWLGRKSILKLRAIPIACISTMVTYIMVFLALPNSSAFTYTDEKPLIELSIYFLMVSNVLIGFGSACIQTGLYNYIGHMNPHKCTPPIVHLKFILNISSGVSYYYSSYLGLQIQIAILMLFAILAFCVFYGCLNKSYLAEAKEAGSRDNLENKSESVQTIENKYKS